MTEQAEAWAPIVKTSKNPDGTLYVYGKVSDDSLDNDEQKCDSAWLGRAVPQWFAESGNIREQHSRIAAGKAVEHEVKADGGHYLKALVVDPVSVMKVETNVLKGFSIGIKRPRITLDKSAPGGRIVDGKIVEVSLVDRPCNPGCLVTIVKADSNGDAELVDQALTETPAPSVKTDGENVTTATPEATDPAASTTETPKADEPTGPEFLTKADAAELTKGIADAVAVAVTNAIADAVAVALPDVVKAELPAALPAAVPEAVTDMLNDAVTKAMEPVTAALKATDEAIKATDAAQKASDDRLAKVEALPTPGGPVLTRTAGQIASADGLDKSLVKAEYDDLLRKADEAQTNGSHLLAKGYRDKAAELAPRL